MPRRAAGAGRPLAERGRIANEGMTSAFSAHGRHTLDGTVRVFLAEALILPTGLVTTAVLTRNLGTEGYGLFTLAATLVTWVEWCISALFARATYLRISEAADWRPIGTTVLRLHLAVSTASAAVLLLLADPVARMLGEPVLSGYLRLFAIDIPIASVAHAHRDLLIGMGGFRQRALISAGRWTVRLLLIVALVGLGFSVPGAIVASMGATLVAAGIGRCFVRASLFTRTQASARSLLGHAVPLFLCSICMMAVDRLDLFFLKTLGGSADLAGIYGVAQNLAIVPRLFALAFAPLLLSTLTRLLRDGDQRLARGMGRDGMRLVLVLLPFAAMAAGAAGEVVEAIAGRRFGAAGPLLAILLFGGLASTMMSVGTAVLTAGGRSGMTFVIAGPLVPAAIVGHLLAIPRFGAVGAAAVTAACTVLGALGTMAAVYRYWRIAPPVGSLVRSVVVGGGAYALAAGWPVSGLLLPVKFAVIMLLIAAGLLGLGEFDRREVALARSLVPWSLQVAHDE